MKYLNKLFAYIDDRQSHPESSATLTSTLYSITFVPKSYRSSSRANSTSRESVSPSRQVEATQFSRNKITIVAHGGPVKFSSWKDSSTSLLDTKTASGGGRTEVSTGAEVQRRERRRERHRRILRQRSDKKEGESSSLGGYLLTATIGKTIASTSAITSQVGENKLDSRPTSSIEEEEEEGGEGEDILALIESEDDWILVDKLSSPLPSTSTYHKQNCDISEKSSTKLQQMALDKTDVELIKASWVPVRKDPVASGVLLFKGLFTKFPLYLKFFPQFSDLDIEHMQENKRLVKHAVKVIETITFVVDSIGDESQTSLLNEALVNLVKSHLRRRIGLTEFRNLGIVLIDFICDVNHRRAGNTISGSVSNKDKHSQVVNKQSLSSNESSDDSETMTSALDKIRASSTPSSSSSSEEEGYMKHSVSVSVSGTGAGYGSGGGMTTTTIITSSTNIKAKNNLSSSDNNFKTNTSKTDYQETSKRRVMKQDDDGDDDDDENNKHNNNENEDGDGEDEDVVVVSSTEADCNNEAKIDTNLLVAAWTKLYSSILDLVKREEG